MLTLSSSIYRGGEWRVERDPSNPSRFRVVVVGATEYSAPMRWAALGFLNECARSREGQRPDLFSGALDDPACFYFAMSLDIGEMRPRS